jgi:hypothetical protein
MKDSLYEKCAVKPTKKVWKMKISRFFVVILQPNLKLPEDESIFCNSIILPDGQFRVGSDQFHAAHNLVSDA